MDFAKLLNDLKAQATKVATDLDLDAKIEQGKDLSAEALERLKTDRNAQIAATGAGGLLLAAMLGTRGGRSFIGGAAKTGAVAALGALAYKAWQDRQGEPASDADMDAIGFVTDKKMDSEFAEALVRTMVSAAWADGNLDADEKAAIETALNHAGSDEAARQLLTGAEPEATTLAKIAHAARSPNHAAQLYTAACIVTGSPNVSEAGFLSRLAGALGIEENHARAIRDQAAVG